MIRYLANSSYQLPADVTGTAHDYQTLPGFQKTVGASDPEWFTEVTWQVGERAADDDIAAGRTVFSASGEEFLESL